MSESRWPSALDEALSGRYVVEHELARGGMATVYRAREVATDRAVALKVLRPSLANAIGRRRFEREIHVVATLAHPLIVPLLANGAVDDLLYYVMPLIEGPTLRDHLTLRHRLGCDEAVSIGCDLADALGHAHRLGVLHRDVKPENVLLLHGRALVADFGLARAIGATETTRLTATGTSVGTVEYMSPEQLESEDDLDERTDVYSLACVLFELLTGEPPFSGTSLHSLVRRILTAPPPRVRGFRVDVPAYLDEAIVRSLAKAPEERHSSMAALSRALRQPD